MVPKIRAQIALCQLNAPRPHWRLFENNKRRRTLSTDFYHNEFNDIFALTRHRRREIAALNRLRREGLTGVIRRLNYRKPRSVTVHAVLYHLLFLNYFANSGVYFSDL